MATRTVGADTANENPAQEIFEIATELQVLCSRIRSLAGGIDDAADHLMHGPNPTALESVCNFAVLIEREAAEAGGIGERIEVLAMDLKRGA